MLIIFRGVTIWVSPRVGLPLTLLALKVYGLF